MLPKCHRLKRRSDVLRVRRLGKAWRHPLAILLVVQAEPRSASPGVAEMNSAPPVRFAFTASRQAGSAVARNRGKRLLREAVRGYLEQIEPGWDCLFIVREGTPRADFKAVQSAVYSLLRRAKLVEP
ncbi:MAG: ribonuclease P protein component [Candidatus Promineifilaceae bacterium]|jgi:ribonuclease P protein component